MTRVLLVVCLLLSNGCTVMQSAQYAAARYCAIPAAVRAANREAVAYAVAPHRISIQCAGGAYE